METIYFIVLVPMVYLACIIFIIGLILRLVKVFGAPPNPTSLNMFPQKSSGWLHVLSDTFLFPTIRRHKPRLWVFLMIFHIALLLLFLGHLELFSDFRILQVIEHEVFLGHGFVGLAILVCVIYFFLRRIKSPVRELSVPEDYFLLLLLLLTAIFGSQMDWGRTWYGYGELSVEDYREYLMNLITFRFEVPYMVNSAGHSFMLVLHVFFANLLIMYFPFSHLMHAIFSLPMNKLRRG